MSHNMRSRLIELINYMFVLIVAWLLITAVIWQYNNPKGNSITFYTHFMDAIQYKRVAKFQ